MNADLKRIRTEAETAVLEAFAAIEDELPGRAETHAARRGRIGLFERHGLPHRRIEEWKYTDLRTLMRSVAPLAENATRVDVPAALIDGAVQIVIADGFVQSSAGIDGLTVTSLGDALADGAAELAGADTPDRAIDAINAAFVRDGVIVSVDGGADVATPIELVFIGSDADTMSHARAHVVVGEGASLTLVERHVSPEGSSRQGSVVVKYAVGDGASLDVLRLQDEGGEAVHLGESAFDIAADANVKLMHINTGAKIARVETRATFMGENARFDVAGVTMAAERQHSDQTLYVDHLVPHCESTETFKTVIDDAAKAIFQGKIVVAQDAQKTDAQMASDALLLSEAADMIAKPELEIFADDVSCAHGATCGEIDEDLMFYLSSRGIPPLEARKLLLQAFLSEGAEIFEDHPFEEIAFAAIERWLTDHADRVV